MSESLQATTQKLTRPLLGKMTYQQWLNQLLKLTNSEADEGMTLAEELEFGLGLVKSMLPSDLRASNKVGGSGCL